MIILNVQIKLKNFQEREVLSMIYLDNAATTKVDSSVMNSFVKVNESLYFNPNSPHQAGLQAEKLLQQAKEQINQALKLNHLYDIILI